MPEEIVVDEATAKIIDEIAVKVHRRFSTFGGGYASSGNPLSMALIDKPLQFAAGVDVKAVIAVVLNSIGEIAKERGLR